VERAVECLAAELHRAAVSDSLGGLPARCSVPARDWLAKGVGLGVIEVFHRAPLARLPAFPLQQHHEPVAQRRTEPNNGTQEPK